MMVDVVDDMNRPIGRARRSDLFALKQNFRTVHILLVGENGAFLLQQLPKNHLRSPGKLGSSVAGYLEAGESYEMAAHRKLWEELRLTTTLAFAGGVTMLDEGCIKYIEVYKGRTSMRPRFNHREIASIARMPSFELEKLMLKNSDAFTKTFVAIYEKLGRDAFQRIGEERTPPESL